MATQEQKIESLNRATGNNSVYNYGAIYSGFAAKGIAECDVQPRENVFTYNAWLALGRQVRKGEKGVKVVTWIVTAGRVDDATGERAPGRRFPKTTTVFHITQTDPIVAA